MGIKASRSGFTIVELLIVIVVIGILAAISLVAYNGITHRAKISALQSGLSQALKKIEVYKVVNADTYPTTLAAADVTAPNGTIYNYQVSGNSFCLSASSESISYKVSNSNSAPIEGTCSGVLANGTNCPSGFVVVPGNSTFGTGEFCVMKYEAKIVGQNNGSQTYSSSLVPESRASGTPWVNISQTDAITEASTVVGCSGCHLISEAEWVTIAANIITVPSNWSGGSVGSGYLYSGNNDNTPPNSLAADSNDSNSYAGTSNTSPSNQRRTFNLSNGEVIWDMAGNVYEWTNGTIAGGQQPGLPGETEFSWKEYNNSSLLWNGLPSIARPSNIYPGAGSWSSTQGIGFLHSYVGDSTLRGFYRGGTWGNNNTGILTLVLNAAPSTVSTGIGFRVAR